MLLIIVGTGTMGKIIQECAEEDGTFSQIQMVEPLDKKWPDQRADLIIDFSHPKAIQGIYEYARSQGGNIPVVIGTTGQKTEDEEIIKLLEKICPVCRKTNFSKGIDVMNKLAGEGKKMMGQCDIAVEEIHHTKKKDAPSGTAKTLCNSLGIPEEDAVSLRMGTVFGKHKVYFALEDEVLEITHTAFSKRIFANGALEQGKKMISVGQGKPEDLGEKRETIAAVKVDDNIKL